MSRSFIIIAEDDADDRYLMQTALKQTDIQDVSFVEDGVELLTLLQTIEQKKNEASLPKLILLDLNMPKMDGREVLVKIKSNEFFRRIPVIIFSTTKNPVEVKRCYDLGANTYIVKPVSYDVLVKTLNELSIYWFNIATLSEELA